MSYVLYAITVLCGNNGYELQAGNNCMYNGRVV